MAALSVARRHTPSQVGDYGPRNQESGNPLTISRTVDRGGAESEHPRRHTPSQVGDYGPRNQESGNPLTISRTVDRGAAESEHPLCGGLFGSSSLVSRSACLRHCPFGAGGRGISESEGGAESEHPLEREGP